jgi:hypothetical protein
MKGREESQSRVKTAAKVKGKRGRVAGQQNLRVIGERKALPLRLCLQYSVYFVSPTILSV